MTSNPPTTGNVPGTINPLLDAWPDSRHGLPPFDAIAPAHFPDAFAQAMQVHRTEIDAIAHSTQPPTFDNTVAAFDIAGRMFRRVELTLQNLTASATSPALQQVQRDMAQPMAAHENAIHLHVALFARVDLLHGRRQTLGLDAESLRLLERVHLDFVRAGATLQGEARERFAHVEEALAQCMTQFGQNVLADESAWHLPLESEADFAGLPSAVRDATRQAAVERGLTGHIVTLGRSMVVPFLTFSEQRALRETVWRAWTSRGAHPGPHDNRALMRTILLLRAEKAALLGYATYADYALTDRMALEPAAVNALLTDVWERAKSALDVERAQLREAQRQASPASPAVAWPIEPWDWRFWAEGVRRHAYALDDTELRPYFSLDRMVEAAFDCARRLFGTTFTRRPDWSTYHPDVVAYEVRDAQADRFIGVFLHDNFSRPGKRSGAWMNAYRWQSRVHGDVTPVIVNNNNFNKPPAGELALLSFDDVRTLFHEFGHGLHGLLSSVTYERLSGTSVRRDFVELPSQLFEHWALEPQVLRRHALHVTTGQPIPDALIGKLQRARLFGQGYETVRYVASALTDMAAHGLTVETMPADLVAFEDDVMRRHGLPEGTGLNHRFTHFQHLFAGDGYAAGYYVYLWAEVLDADAFTAFEDAGDVFDTVVAARLKAHIYSAGDRADPGEAYRSFRGRAPQQHAMLRQRGLVPA